jgi:hypothetical protein
MSSSIPVPTSPPTQSQRALRRSSRLSKGPTFSYAEADDPEEEIYNCGSRKSRAKKRNATPSPPKPKPKPKPNPKPNPKRKQTTTTTTIPRGKRKKKKKERSNIAQQALVVLQSLEERTPTSMKDLWEKVKSKVPRRRYYDALAIMEAAKVIHPSFDKYGAVCFTKRPG